MYKGNFIPCLCTLFFPFSSVGRCICCAKAYSARQETIFRLKIQGERSRWLWHLGNCVAFTLPFSACRRKTGMSSFIIFLSIFKEMEFCHLFFVGCSLMFSIFHGQKKRLLKNSKVSSAASFCFVLKMHVHSRLGHVKHIKTGFIKTQVIAVKCKHIIHKIQVDYREQTLLALCAELQV